MSWGAWHGHGKPFLGFFAIIKLSDAFPALPKQLPVPEMTFPDNFLGNLGQKHSVFSAL